MHRQSPRRKYLLSIVLCILPILPVVVNAQQEGIGPKHLSQQHTEVVDRWLAGKSDLRLATLADCLNKDGLAATREQHGKSYHPYYAVGDFNHDKREDFAVVLVNKRKKKDKFAVAVFNGALGKNTVPAYFGEGWDLSDGGLFEGSDGILAGPFESDNCVILRPRRKTYVVVACIED